MAHAASETDINPLSTVWLQKDHFLARFGKSRSSMYCNTLASIPSIISVTLEPSSTCSRFQMTERKNWWSLNDQYSSPSYWWAAETLQRQAWLRFPREREANAIDFIDTLSNNPIVRGKDWENLIHHYLGIRGTLRNLEMGQIRKDFVIPPTAGTLGSVCPRTIESIMTWNI